MGRLIDADLTLIEAWQNFYKQEEEHEKNIDDYDILRDQFYEQSGFECCQQAIVNAPTVEAIPKADYENRLKADMVAMLVELDLTIDEIPIVTRHGVTGTVMTAQGMRKKIKENIQQKIDAMKREQEETE